MGRFRPRRWTDYKGKKRNNYYKKGRTKHTEGHINDQLGVGISIIAIMIGIGRYIDSSIANHILSIIITIIISIILGGCVYYIYKKFYS